MLLHTIERENSAYFHHSIKIQNDYTKRIDYCLLFSQIKFPNFPVFSASLPITCKKCSKSILFRHAFHSIVPYSAKKGSVPQDRPLQSVKKAANRQNPAELQGLSKNHSFPKNARNPCVLTDAGEITCFARHFDFLRNSRSTVPPYADERELLVLTASLTSASL